jgi:hypothetical protein
LGGTKHVVAAFGVPHGCSISAEGAMPVLGTSEIAHQISDADIESIGQDLQSL